MESNRSQAAQLTWAVPNNPNMALAKPGEEKKPNFGNNLVFKKKDEEKVEKEDSLNIGTLRGKITDL